MSKSNGLDQQGENLMMEQKETLSGMRICVLFYITICNIAAGFTSASNDLNLQPQRTNTQMPTILSLQFQSCCTSSTGYCNFCQIAIILSNVHDLISSWPCCPSVVVLPCCSPVIEPSKQKHAIIYLLSSHAASFTSHPYSSLSTLISTKLLIWLCTELFSVLLLLCHVFLCNE